MSDNDLIRRGDVLDALEHRVGTVSQWNLVTKAINAIPAVTGEPVYQIKELYGIHEHWIDVSKSGYESHISFSSLNRRTLYTTPQDQSAL